jgi:hypothetical protein
MRLCRVAPSARSFPPERRVVIDASEMIGARQLAAAVVLSKGSTQRTVSSFTVASLGVWPGVLVSRLLRRTPPDLPGGQFETPDFGGVGLLAVTDSELVLLELRVKFVKRLVEVTDRVPLADVRAAVMGGDWEAPYAPRVTIAFTDQPGWQFEANSMARRRVNRVVRMLADRVASA